MLQALKLDEGAPHKGLLKFEDLYEMVRAGNKIKGLLQTRQELAVGCISSRASRQGLTPLLSVR